MAEHHDAGLRLTATPQPLRRSAERFDDLLSHLEIQRPDVYIRASDML
jgi:hypothetical protein